MKKSLGTVLVTGDQGRVGLTTVRALARAGYRAAVTVSEGPSLAAASRHCVATVPVPPTDDPSYAPAVVAEVSSGRYLTCLPVSDTALLRLGPGIPDLVDKDKLGLRAQEVGLKTPPSQTFASLDELRAHANELAYPLVVKPLLRKFRAFRADRPSDLHKPIPDGSFVVQPFISQPIRSVGGVMWRGDLVASAHSEWLRMWPPECGQACWAVTVAPDLALEGQLIQLLADYEGVFNIQLVGDHLIDVHLRTYGTQSHAVKAGVNLVGIWCDLLRGEHSELVRAKVGVHYRWIFGHIRRVRYEVRRTGLRGKHARELRPRRHTAHGIESLSDPSPMLTRSAFHARRAQTHGSPLKPWVSDGSSAT